MDFDLTACDTYRNTQTYIFRNALEFLQPLHPYLSPLGVTRKVQNSTFHQQGLITSGFRGATVTRDKTNRCTSDTSFSLSLTFSLPPFLSLHLLHFVCGWADQQTGPLIGRAQTAAGVTRATAVQLLLKHLSENYICSTFNLISLLLSLRLYFSVIH